MLYFPIKYTTFVRTGFLHKSKFILVEQHADGERGNFFSEKVVTGKRTYFFDVKATLSNDYYITITESKKKYNKEGDGFTYEKHKLFLYKENFNKFARALDNAINHVKKELMPDIDFAQFDQLED